VYVLGLDGIMTGVEYCTLDDVDEACYVEPAGIIQECIRKVRCMVQRALIFGLGD